MEKSKAPPVCFLSIPVLFGFPLPLPTPFAPIPIEELFRQQHQKKKIDPIWPREKNKSSTWGIIAFIKPNFFVVKPTPIRSETNSSIKAHHTTAHQKVS
jgi:hypothetical protein